MRELTPQQEKFCQEYIKTGNAYKSYIAVGYASKGARAASSKLLTKVYIKQRLQELKEMQTKKFLIDKAFITEKFLEIHEIGLEENMQVAKGALDSLVKLYGLNEAEKIDMTTKSDVTVGGLAELLKVIDKDEDETN